MEYSDNYYQEPSTVKVHAHVDAEDCPSRTQAMKEIEERRGWKPLDGWKAVLGEPLAKK